MVLQSIRERLTGILAFAILGILIIPFALVGVNEYFTNNSGNLVARVNDTEITYNEYTQGFSEYRRRMQSMLGANYDPVEFDQLVVRREYLDNMIDQELVSQAAQSMGLDVDDQTLAEEISKIPAFQVEGQFNQDVYLSALMSQGMTPKQFQREMRAQYVVNQLPMSIASSSIATPTEMERFVALANQTRTFGTILVPTKQPDEPVEFTEEEIQAWYDTHSDEYMSVERVIIEYVELNTEFIEMGPAPDEDYLREQFETQKGRFISPEQRKVSHILLTVDATADEAEKETARQQAEDLARRAREGEDFTELAKEFSQDQGSASQGGDLGWVEPGVMVQAFEKAMYELSMEAPVSAPVETGFGWHVIKLTDLREAEGMSFEEARETLVREYEEENAARAFLEMADRLVDIIYEDPTTLESAALVMGLEIQEAGPFSRDGGEGIAAIPDVVQTAFSDLVLLQGSVSDPVNLDENSLVMIKLKEHLPVALKPLEEVREEIITTLAENLALERAEAEAGEVLASLEAGETDMETLAGELGLEFSLQENANRNSGQPDLTLVQEVFRLQQPAEGGVVRKVLPSSNGFGVVELTAVTDGVLDADAVFAVQQYERVIANGHASLETAAVLDQLRAAADIEVFEDRIR
jgi:peptidyl-prolyl cis-trans isomerase D